MENEFISSVSKAVGKNKFMNQGEPFWFYCEHGASEWITDTEQISDNEDMMLVYRSLWIWC